MFSGSKIIRWGLPVLVAAGCAVGASSALAAAKPPARPAGPRTGRLLKPAGTHFATASARRSKAGASAVHSITSCGYVASSPGTYNVMNNLYDSGSGDCITVEANHVTLNLNSHTITGTGTDTCIYVEDTSNGYDSVGDSVIGGAKGSPRATLRHCEYGLYVYLTSGTTASRINIDNPSYGVYEDYAAGSNLSQITVYAPSGVNYGFYLYAGSGNTVSQSVVNSDLTSSEYGFYNEYEYGDHFTSDTATANTPAGDSGSGFVEYYSNRNTYSGDKALGQLYGFYVYGDTYGTVTLTNNTANDLTSDEYGFYVYLAELYSDYNDPVHTVVAGNTTNGYYYGFYDESDAAYSTRETYSNNTADDYSGYGFYFEYPVDYTITGNTADANTTSTSTPRWVSGTYGFYFSDTAYSYYAPETFSDNKSYDNEYGFYSDSYAISGTNNIAKRDRYASYDVQYNS
jgi:hypothetical protein